MKTPIQELIEKMLDVRRILTDVSELVSTPSDTIQAKIEMLTDCIELAESLLEKEKENRKAVFSIAYRMMPTEYDSAHIDKVSSECVEHPSTNTVNRWEMYPLKAMSYRFKSCSDY
jgi:hypothetical protein